MLMLLKKRCAFAGDRVRTAHADFATPDDLTCASMFDLVVSHFSLDCMSQEQVESLARWVANRMRPGTLWMVSDFGLPETEPWCSLAQMYIDLLYFAFRILTNLQVRRLPAIQSALHQAGFRRIRRKQILKGFLWSELWELEERN